MKLPNQVRLLDTNVYGIAIKWRLTDKYEVISMDIEIGSPIVTCLGNVKMSEIEVITWHEGV